MGIDKKSLKRNSIVLYAALFLIVAFIMASSNFQVKRVSADTITTFQNNNQLNLNPFETQFTSFDVYDAATGKSLGSQSPSKIYSDGDTLWEAPSTNYPDLEMFVSQPFLVNNAGALPYGGAGSENETNYIVDPNQRITFGIDNNTGQYIYLTKVNVAFDYFVKTIANMPNPSYGFYPVDPLDGITNSMWVTDAIPPIFGGTVAGTSIFNSGSHYVISAYNSNQDKNRMGTRPIGVILAGWNPGTCVISDNDPTSWYIGGPPNQVGISNSIEDFTNPTQMEYNLQHNYGNSQVKVVANINIKLLNNNLMYDYYKQIGNSIYEVKSANTQMGVYDASLISGTNLAGNVSNYIQTTAYSQITSGDINSNPVNAIATGNAITSEVSPPASQTNLGFPGEGSTAVAAYWKCSATQNVLEAGKGMIPTQTLGKPSTLPVSTPITLQNFNQTMVSSATVQLTDRIQPYATAGFATYNGVAAGISHWSNAVQSVFDDDAVVITKCLNTKTGAYTAAYFPYSMTIQNTWIAHRIMITYLVATENNVFYCPSNGAPVKVSDFADYGINEVGLLNPNLSDAGGTVIFTEKNLLDAFLDWLAALAQYWIVILIFFIAIIIGIVAIMLARKPKSNAPSSRTFNFSIGGNIIVGSSGERKPVSRATTIPKQRPSGILSRIKLWLSGDVRSKSSPQLSRYRSLVNKHQNKRYSINQRIWHR